MKRQDQNFGYKLSFRQKLEGDAYTTVTVSRFASAKTPEEAIDNLEKILNGLIPVRHISGINAGDNLFKLDLMYIHQKNLMTLHVSRIGEKCFKVNWRMAVFHDVDAALWGALIKTFPEQKNLFKGNMLEEAMGI
jgi:hypothetical protein